MRSTSASTSRGVTIRSPSRSETTRSTHAATFSSSASVPPSARIMSLMASLAMVEAYTTIGTPTAMTGAPIVSRVSARWWLPTPEPGVIPVSVTWMVEPMRRELRAASASTAITASGRTCSTMPCSTSAVSTPVTPSTPGEAAQTLGVAEHVSFAGPKPWEKIDLYYAVGDVFVSATRSETQGLTYVEAMASGQCVCAVNDACLSGVMEDGVSGVLTEDDDDALLAGLVRAFSDEGRQIAASAPVHARPFGTEAFAERVESCYLHAIESRRTRGMPIEE